MITNLYQEYLFVIGKLKDTYNLHVDVDHKDIHTFYKDKKPLFKLFFGMFTKEEENSIVVSFHIDMFHAEAIQWFINIYNLHPLIKIHDSYIEDSNGETFLGEDAMAIREVFQSQEILSEWLENHDREDTEYFVKSKVVGRQRDHTKIFDSQVERDKAIIEFDKIRKPEDDEGVH